MTPSEQAKSHEEKTVQETLERLQSDPKKGLSQQEAIKRQEQYGPNAIEEEKQSPIIKFFSHFWGPIPWMLEVAVILSAIAQRWEDFAVIFIMLLINGGVSFWHENKAENAIEALKEKLALEAKVIREGKSQKIQARDLVPGDIIQLSIGDIVPADAKLLQDQDASIDESSLTGESLPVSKNEGDSVYSGTTVKQGEPKAVVTATGNNTKFAKTVELVETAEEKSHFQQAVLRIGYFLISITAVLVLIIIANGLWRGDPAFEVLIFAMVLTIAGIPQALPAVLTVTMTVGANRLARMKTIVSRLAAMEEMAGLEVLCADKTGTLTKNELTMQEPILFNDYDEHELVLSAALTARQDSEDPIDKAILAGVDDPDELNQYEIADFKPFDPSRKRADATVKKNGRELTVSKGAPQKILELIEADEDKRSQILDKVRDLANSGFRALGVAKKEDDNPWEYLGIISLLDPPREDSNLVLVFRDADRCEPGSDPNHHVSQTLSSWSSDYFPYTEYRCLMAKTVAQPSIILDVGRYPNYRYSFCRLWVVGSSDRLGVCVNRLGICHCLDIDPQRCKNLHVSQSPEARLTFKKKNNELRELLGYDMTNQPK